MKYFYVFLFLLSPILGYSQTVSVDDTGHNAEDLARLLFESGCVEITNASFSSSASVATFSNNGGSFPIADGIIIRSGKAKYTQGSYTGNNLSSQENNLSDPDLQNISNAAGQTGNITDVAYLQFDFVPLSNHFKFNFLFSSNEYGQWQCYSTDAFAFLLTNLNTGVTTNLAVIPNTTIPVSVSNIRDNTYNQSCSSQHPNLFGDFNVYDPQNSTINMKGHTVVMSAAANISPGVPYRIRLVIGDSNDPDFDSAIFLQSGSFTTSVNLGANRSICSGDSIAIGTGLDATVYTHVWKRNGQIIPGENAASLSVTQPGTYTVEVTRAGSTCTVTDEVVFSNLQVNSPQNLSVCNSGSASYLYDLTQNNTNALGLNNAIYDLYYYASMADVNADNPIPNADLTAYQSAGNQTIYIKIYNTQSGNFCNAVYSFKLLVDAPIQANSPNPIEVCFNPAGYTIDLTQVAGQILGSQSANDFTVTYYEQNQAAQNGQNSIADSTQYTLPSGFSSMTLWARVTDNEDGGCFNLVSFLILENPLPQVSQLPDVVDCSGYTLPPITHGEYYSAPNGQGAHYNSGDVLTADGTYYIYSGPDANGCTNQSSFEVVILDNYDLSGIYCDHFTVPNPPAGNFYTAIDGPNGSGSIIPPGTVLTTDQTIYFYAEINGVLCKNIGFDIDVHPLPPVDHPSDVVTCINYTLPPLTDGDYYSGANGSGTTYSAGDLISSSMKMYVFADDDTCTHQSSFQITIIPSFPDSINACGSYVLPQLEAGHYYTQASGQGQQIPFGTEIFSDSTIFVYAQTTSLPNCTDSLFFHVDIKPIPPVDSLANVFLCVGETYTLPTLTHGEYFTQSNRNGTQLFPGDPITTTQEIYINSINNFCADETSFTVSFDSLPPVSHYADVYSCGAYTYDLPDPEYGKVYTQPNGQGQQLQQGQVIDSTLTLYIYNQSEEQPYCASQEEFTIYVFTDVEVGNFEDVAACDSYTLPNITTGHYFTKPGGRGDTLFPGYVIDSSQTIYVYAQNHERFLCESEDSIRISISETPELPAFHDIIKCESYTLPTLSDSSYVVDYFRKPNGQDKITANQYTFDEPGTYTIYVFATAPDNANCFDQEKFTLTIKPLQQMDFSNAVICVDPRTGMPLDSIYFDSQVDTSLFRVDWYLAGEKVHSGSDYWATEGGIYTVQTVKLDPNDTLICNYESAHFIIHESSKPLIKAYTSDDFADQIDVHVEIVQGEGEFVYQLDDGPFQAGNIFKNVSSGPHIVRVKDPLGDCGVAVTRVQVMKYPKFFTPNGDGVNDRWNIKDLAEHREARIFIFDRYGKLLAQIFPYGLGWNGQFHGKDMPTNDYWFKVVYKVNDQKRVFKSHFTLKR